MAGRGTDIKLGNGVPELGGLSVIAQKDMNPEELTGNCVEDVHDKVIMENQYFT